MQIHSTKGIVIRAVKYGDTSIIATIYTQLFGLQSYIIKGVRGSSAKSTYKANCFQPAAILELEVYHHPQKQIQFIKNYSWSYVYKNIFSNVICNSVAIYIIELLQHSIKQPEPNTDLYNFIEETLIITDTETKDTISNLPIFFTLLLCNHLGFKINGCYLEITPVLDFQEGTFVAETPTHNYFAVEWEAETISWLNSINNYQDLKLLQLNRINRKIILQHLLQYFTIHIHNFGSLKSYQILQEVLD